ncbi:MAG: aspartate-semialdehyde dehydrogenase [Leptonema sp. (in: Bacteria)]|nr:aspartate-semialdehyde dehydrogenase [Leptonema sp. (in: bacteria)]
MGKNIAVVGATGAVGVEILKVLENRNFDIADLKLLASERSAGKKMMFRGKEYTVEALSEDSFHNVHIALFSAGGSITKQYAPAAVASGCIVVDNSSAYRMDPNVPLVIPEINPQDAKKHKGIIANPNCSTIILLMAIYPIYRLCGITKIIVSTYQAASGAGAAAMQELEDQAKAHLANQEIPTKVLPYQLAFNVFSHNSAMDSETGYNQEEIKMVNETHKILGDANIEVSPTCVRVGTFRAHAESIHLELKSKADLSKVRQALAEFPGVKLEDNVELNRFPMPLEVSGKDDVYVGRIRTDYKDSSGKTLQLFVVGDQLLKGAALNAVQVAELL